MVLLFAYSPTSGTVSSAISNVTTRISTSARLGTTPSHESHAGTFPLLAVAIPSGVILIAVMLVVLYMWRGNRSRDVQDPRPDFAMLEIKNNES